MSEPSSGGKPHWSVDKRINIGNLVASGVIIVTAVAWAVRQEAAIEKNAENIEDNAQEILASEERQKSSIRAVEYRQNSKFTEIKNLLQRIEDKLDRKADK